MVGDESSIYAFNIQSQAIYFLFAGFFFKAKTLNLTPWNEFGIYLLDDMFHQLIFVKRQCKNVFKLKRLWLFERYNLYANDMRILVFGKTFAPGYIYIYLSKNIGNVTLSQCQNRFLCTGGWVRVIHSDQWATIKSTWEGLSHSRPAKGIVQMYLNFTVVLLNSLRNVNWVH